MRHRREWTSRLQHDLKNPLFLIQAFTWSYLDRLKKKNLTPSEMELSSNKMAEVLNRQAKKALEVLKTSSPDKPRSPKTASSSPGHPF